MDNVLLIERESKLYWFSGMAAMSFEKDGWIQDGSGNLHLHHSLFTKRDTGAKGFGDWGYNL